jgi:hypothetical protein
MQAPEMKRTGQVSRITLSRFLNFPTRTGWGRGSGPLYKLSTVPARLLWFSRNLVVSPCCQITFDGL